MLRRVATSAILLPYLIPITVTAHARTLTPVTMALINAARDPIGRHRSHMTRVRRVTDDLTLRTLGRGYHRNS